MINYIREKIDNSITYKTNILSNLDILNEIKTAVKMICKAYKTGNKLLLFGNGGSAADAQHLAAELVSRFRMERKALPALALTTNSSVVSAIGNDYSFAKIFERQIEALAEPGDIVIGISTSGASKNVHNGLAMAKVKGAFTVGLLGNNGGKALEHCNCAIIVPGTDTPRIQEVHIMIGHIICDIVEQSLFYK